jgi:hypothetical protein
MPWPSGSSTRACTAIQRIRSAKPFLLRFATGRQTRKQWLRLNMEAQSAEGTSQTRGTDMISTWWRRSLKAPGRLISNAKTKQENSRKLYQQPGTGFRKQTVMKPKTVRTKNPISTWRLRRMLLQLPLLLVWFGFPSERAVNPPPDGGYGTRNTAEATGSPFSLTTGACNSAFGFRALYRNATAVRNTALGYQALYNTKRPLQRQRSGQCRRRRKCALRQHGRQLQHRDRVICAFRVFGLAR